MTIRFIRFAATQWLAATLAVAGLVAYAGPTAASAPAAPSGGGLELSLTLSAADADPCASGEQELVVAPGDTARLCMTATNHTGQALSWHTVAHAFGEYLNPARLDANRREEALADGASLQLQARARIARSTDVAAAWSALDADAVLPDYSYDDTAAFEAIDLGSSPTAVDLGLTRPGLFAAVTLPFSFNFYGVQTNWLCVTNDGAMLAGQQNCAIYSYDYGGGGVGSTCCTELMIAPGVLASSNSASGFVGGTVYYDVVGDAPNRRFVVEWRDKQFSWAPGAGVTFQAILDEATSDITFQYVSMQVGNPAFDDGGSLGAGLQIDQWTYTAYSEHQPQLTDGKAVRWTLSAEPYVAAATAAAHITVAAPAASVAPARLEASAAVGESTQATLHIGNSGNADLDWHLAAHPASGRGAEILKRYSAPLVTMMAMPSPSSRAADPTRSAPSHDAAAAGGVQGTASVPAFAHAWGGTQNSRYVSLDAADPTTLNRISFDVSIWPVHVGAFVGDDFSRQYLFGNADCSDDACWDFDLRLVNTVADAGSGGGILYGGPIAPNLVDQIWQGATWDATTRTLFAVASTRETSGTPYRSDLYAVDPDSGRPTWIAQIDDLSASGSAIADVAVRSDGTLYAVEMLTDTLIRIDKLTGHIEPVGSTGLDVGYYLLQSMDFDRSTDTLYYATWLRTGSGPEMYTLDTASGQATLVAAIGDGSGLKALAIAVPGGPCVNPQDVPWLDFDRSSGTTAAGATDDVAVVLDAGALTAGTYAATICVAGNTPHASMLAVPVEFTVGIADRVFADGFDGTP